MTFCSVHKFPRCTITLQSNGEALTCLCFGETAEPTESVPELHHLVVRQLEEYFAGKRKVFDVPVSVKGTEFQIAVWNELKKIPYGETRSYKDIASAIGDPKASRAVGNANHNNPISIIIPCHRVITSNGLLGGYGGGLELKLYLLDLEGMNSF